jgi:FkbM family methyltransferase
MTRRKLAFVLAASDHGPIILNRLDYCRTSDGREYGVGIDLLQSGSYSSGDIDLLFQLLRARREHFGDGVVAIDCGANIGVHTVDLAKRMTDWGQIIAVEAQERLFYALAGNIALNNCLNARAIFAAVSAVPGPIRIPVPDYLSPGSFGSLELRPSDMPEFIGQTIDYDAVALTEIAGITIDSLSLKRLDLIKIDVEGMELEVLEGAQATLRAFYPIVFAEHIKVGPQRLNDALESIGYKVFVYGMNTLGIHLTDPTLPLIAQG